MNDKLTPEARALMTLMFRRRRPSQFGKARSDGGWLTNPPQSFQKALELLSGGKIHAARHCRSILRSAVRKQEPKKARLNPTQWKRVRYEALKSADGRCKCCGRSAKDGVKLHVDHIKPVSKYPQLAYELSNLQVLCDECNIGKLDRDETDWR